MYIKVIPICWQWQQSCSSERDALFSLVLQGNEYWAYEVSATVRWLTLSQTQAGHIWGYVLCMSYRIPIRIYIYTIYVCILVQKHPESCFSFRLGHMPISWTLISNIINTISIAVSSSKQSPHQAPKCSSSPWKSSLFGSLQDLRFPSPKYHPVKGGVM